MSEPLVIYHADCSDGFCAAWLFHQAYPDADFHPAHYGTDPPDVKDRDVYIVDFSYKRPVMEAIAAQAKNVVVLDHHKTAEAELAGMPAADVYFDMSKSGGRLTWEYLKCQELLPPSFTAWSIREAPWIVDYTEDRDLWKWKLPDSREINAALRSYPLDFAVWDKLWGAVGTGALVREGSAILRCQQQVVDDHVKRAGEVQIAGHKVLCVNATTLISEIAGELAKVGAFGVCYFDRADGKRVYSLRSASDGVDVSEIAKSYWWRRS